MWPLTTKILNRIFRTLNLTQLVVDRSPQTPVNVANK